MIMHVSVPNYIINRLLFGHGEAASQARMALWLAIPRFFILWAGCAFCGLVWPPVCALFRETLAGATE